MDIRGRAFAIFDTFGPSAADRLLEAAAVAGNSPSETGEFLYAAEGAAWTCVSTYRRVMEFAVHVGPCQPYKDDLDMDPDDACPIEVLEYGLAGGDREGFESALAATTPARAHWLRTEVLKQKHAELPLDRSRALRPEGPGTLNFYNDRGIIPRLTGTPWWASIEESDEPSP
jgi:hypothetical protein